MDWTYDEYIDFVNHLFLQEFADFDYHFDLRGSMPHALEVR
jgi:hypothetical protein